jgi:WD40 repeat protein
MKHCYCRILTCRELYAGIFVLVLSAQIGGDCFQVRAEPKSRAKRSPMEERVSKRRKLKFVNKAEYAFRTRERMRRLRLKLLPNSPRVQHECATGPIDEIGVSPGGSLLALLENSSVVVWDIKGKRQRLHKPPRGVEVRTAALMPRENKVIRVCLLEGDRWGVTIEDVKRGKLQSLPGTFSGYGPFGIVAAEKSSVLMCSTPEMGRFWRIGSRPAYGEFAHTRGLSGGVAAIHPDGTLFAAASPAFAAIYSLTTGKMKLEYRNVPGMFIGAITFSSSGKYLAVAGEEFLVGERTVVWEWEKQEKVFDEQGQGRDIPWICFSNSERLLATVNKHSIVSIWHLGQNKAPVRFVVKSAVSGGITFSNDDQLLVIGCEDGIKAFRVADLLPKK